jgi:hypothetical protein
MNTHFIVDKHLFFIYPDVEGKDISPILMQLRSTVLVSVKASYNLIFKLEAVKIYI